MFRIGEQVRVNEGRYYGSIGVITDAAPAIVGGTLYTVRIPNGTVQVNAVLSTFANNGD